MGVSHKDDYSFLAMGMYACVALLGVIVALAEAGVYLKPTCPACVCRIQAKLEDINVNVVFDQWFDKRIFTCPFPTFPKFYYGYRGSRCECAEENVPVRVCQSEIWKLASAFPHDKV